MMRNEDVVIEELNTLLRGTYMGIHALEHHIQKLDEPELKEKFQSMQQEAKQNAQKLAERIQNLNGVPADSEGITGKMHSNMHKMMLSDETPEIIEDALKGMAQYGVEYSEELVRGDLDPESRRLAEEVIDTSRRHAEELRQLLH
ncbi:PA2169 family four-helix-bundle protein [Neobacillus niacini]|uniref:PA2169 family four-helix-bundle protein n=1 Tax=Neobacillus niacini TaxID=86668 RepID=UPI0021CB70D3|nr:PA2169 family four-helix-bundle protein [Neobacillus niacini]MCM3766959.1 PA2169 family four-helix-bundle protein [Neobacillus niacini]